MPDWNTEVLPVLEAVNQAVDRDSKTIGFFVTDDETMNGVLDRDPHDPRTAAILMELAKTGFILAKATMGGHVEMIELTEKGNQHVAGWPVDPGDDAQERLVAALDRLIAD